MKFVKAILAIGVVIVLSTVTLAQMPQVIHFQGRLVDDNGNPITGDHSVTFRIYDQKRDGDLLWQETHNSVTVNEGFYAVLLGSQTSFASTGLTFDQPYWLSIQVDEQPEMTPRHKFAASPYAMNADKVDGKYATDMLDKATYDADGNSKVDAAESADSASSASKADTVDGLHAGDMLDKDTYDGDVNGKVDAADTADSAMRATSADDADTVDGSHAADLLDKATYDTNTDGKVDTAESADTATTANDADTVDGSHLADLLDKATYDANEDGKVGSADTADSAAVAQDFDLLDGLDSTAFAASSSGVCHTNWGSTSCSSGWTAVYSGIAVVYFMNDTGSGSVMESRVYRLPEIGGDNPAVLENNNTFCNGCSPATSAPTCDSSGAGTTGLACVVCCK